jgi:hypothetical protein
VRAGNIVHRLIGECRGELHAKRYEGVVGAVIALLRSQSLSLTRMGRAWGGRAKTKHSVKRMDRLLGNHRMWRDAPKIYAALVKKLILGVPRVVVAIDWTQLPSKMYALTATVVFCGRGLPVYSIVRPESELGNPHAHEAFLDGLRSVFPRCTPILVADAGFRTPFFEACQARGFDFVVRLRGKGVTQTWDFDAAAPDVKERFQSLFARAGKQAQCIGLRVPYGSTRTRQHRLVLGARPKRSRRKPPRAIESYRRRALEPWLLVTSLENEPAEQIVRIYATRMQIEETFRDTKDPRFGWALDHSRTRCPRRFAILLLLAAIASAVATFVGMTAERSGLSRELQANTVRSRRVLSLHRIGNLLIQRARAIGFKLRPIQGLLRDFHRLLTQRPLLPRRDASCPQPHDLFCSDCGDNFRRFGWPT